ncbi:L-seryl-tRNA(Sec) selenium transferase [Peribacillus cavernae]|uniref:L-seryl-tRNA(Sec) selenium transferase n=1 Tax=Peribacillus cavernae TaxID=1674310 RepID=A0A3S0UC04_9BACI|nr:L-seryl-tRNA(Sec) selenium transferase [Peribacillus cavernae]MDQ0220501.1 L-seryl-tRNA(Ser) seleniumtransferase [Peribacillus cavernae]RUQ28005.1 L-seryl-tRNA(Sec) selenium transferase [Peribacillus cavernae]
MVQELLRLIPPVHELQKHERFQDLINNYQYDEKTVTAVIKEKLQEVRQLIQKGEWKDTEPGTDAFVQSLFDAVQRTLDQKYSYRLKRVINATGIVIHTNLGRSRLSEAAIQHVADVARNYSNLEYKLGEGTRGSRHSHIEKWISEITGAEAAMVVNNNAAAVYLVLRALAKQKEVVVSRGQLIEIGGSFRVSSIMEESGATLVEVGTTNKTHLYDYEQAITEETAMLMKVHTSNFKMIGFTEAVEAHKLAALASKHEHILFYEDLGSGVLFDLAKEGIGEEPLVKAVIETGADLVTFSGDKLLGGPQAGIIAGKKYYIDILKKHQLARVLRVDKMTLAALEATLADYVLGRSAASSIPTIRDIMQSEEELLMKAKLFLELVKETEQAFSGEIVQETSAIGGGTMPGIEISTYVVVLRHSHRSAHELHERLRMANPPVITRIKQEEVFFDMRTVTRKEIEEIAIVLGNL